MEDRREDGRVGKAESDEKTSCSGFGVIVLGEDDVHVCQGIPDQSTAGDSRRSHGNNHSDEGGDKLQVSSRAPATSIELTLDIGKPKICPRMGSLGFEEFLCQSAALLAKVAQLAVANKVNRTINQTLSLPVADPFLVKVSPTPSEAVKANANIPIQDRKYATSLILIKMGHCRIESVRGGIQINQ